MKRAAAGDASRGDPDRAPARIEPRGSGQRGDRPGDGWERLLLLPWPPRLRRRHGRDLLELYRDAFGPPRRAGRLRYWARLLWDSLRHGLAARWTEWYGRRRPDPVAGRGAASGPSAPPGRPAPSDGSTGPCRIPPVDPRSPRRSSIMDRLWQDLGWAARMLAGRPSFTLVAVSTLALGVGLNTALFAVVDAVVLAPLPFPGADRLVALYTADTGEGFEDINVSWPDFRDWTGGTDVLEAAAVMAPTDRNLAGTDEPLRLEAGAISPGYLELFGATPVLGRPFRPEEQDLDSPDVVILGEPLWRSVFGADPGVVGRRVRLDGRSHAVVGVAPELPLVGGVDVWIPLRRTEVVTSRANRFLSAYGRLREGATADTAEEILDRLAAGLEEAHPGTNRDIRATVRPLHEVLVGDVEGPMYRLLGVVAVVLLIACANVANLLLARSATRHREIAVRAALGAGRGRLLRQLLTESLLLAACGGIAGLGVGAFATRLVVATLPADVPRLSMAGIDTGVAAFALILAGGTVLLFGLLPALRGSRADLQGALRAVPGAGGPRRAGGGGTAWTGKLLVVGEVALTLVLLAGAGLLLNTLLRLQAVDPGFEPEGLLTVQLSLSSTRYADPARVDAFHRELLASLEAAPGVVAATAANSLPVVGSGVFRAVIAEGTPVPGPDELSFSDFVQHTWIAPGYFETLRTPLLRGREFTDDDADAPPVAILDETLARTLFGDRNPVGRSVRVFSDEEFPRRVVGVVAGVHRRLWQEEPVRQIYVPLSQDPRAGTALLVRAREDPGALAATVRARVRALDADQPVHDARPMADLLEGALGQQRSLARLVGVFAALALALTLVGLYGVVTYGVQQRVREIGVRQALGATPADIVGRIVREGAALAALGTLLGLAGAVALTRFLESFLYGVEPTDAVTLAVVALVLVLTAGLASWVPARRATRVDPVRALRD